MISQIKDLIPKRLQHDIEDNNVIFRETHRDAKLKILKISGLDEVVPINQDLIHFPEEIFLAIEYKKTCDGILIFKFEGGIETLIFDVKSSMSNSHDHAKKLKCGKNYFLYLANTLNIFKNINILNIPCYYCVFVLKNNEKRTTSLEREPISSDPDNPTYIYVDNDEIIPIRKILGRPIN